MCAPEYDFGIAWRSSFLSKAWFGCLNGVGGCSCVPLIMVSASLAALRPCRKDNQGKDAAVGDAAGADATSVLDTVKERATDSRAQAHHALSLRGISRPIASSTRGVSRRKPSSMDVRPSGGVCPGIARKTIWWGIWVSAPQGVSALSEESAPAARGDEHGEPQRVESFAALSAAARATSVKAIAIMTPVRARTLAKDGPSEPMKKAARSRPMKWKSITRLPASKRSQAASCPL